MLARLPLSLQTSIRGIAGMLLWSLTPMIANSAILSFDPIEEALPFFDRRPLYPDLDSNPPAKATAVTTAHLLPCPLPVNLQLIRDVFPAEDKSIDVVVWFDPRKYDVASHQLAIRLTSGEADAPAQEDRIRQLRQARNFLSLEIPSQFYGKQLTLEITLLDHQGKALGSSSKPLTVAAPKPPRKERTIPLRFDATYHPVPGAPCRVGVPLPRGFVTPEQARKLVVLDPKGHEIPATFESTAKWSKHGTVRWLLVNFLHPAEAMPGDFKLALASNSPSRAPSSKTPSVGTELSAAELSRFAKTLSSNAREPLGAQLVTEAFLQGGFVEHSKGANYAGWSHQTLLTPGQRFVVPADAKWIVESSGETAVSAVCENDFIDPATGEKFCKFKARLRIYPDSPFLDFEYTWIFTGDGNRDRIRSMGWSFPAEKFRPAGFLLDDAIPQPGAHLLQYDSAAYKLRDNDGKVIHTGRRAPGLATGETGGATVVMGVRDFWENYPSEIGLSEEGLTFYLWPRHGEPRTHNTTLENAYRLWWAHEGQVLSFALPIELTEAPLYVALSGVEPPFAHGNPESVNAQGIAKTTEIRFCVTKKTDSLGAVRASLEAWNARASEPFAAPEWIVGTGVFPDLHPYSPEAFADFEADYQSAALWPARVAETFQVYGKWIYGDIPMVADVEKKTVGLYRAYDKAHWGWPYSWVPYARSGNPAYRKLADAGARMMTDTAYCHYVSPEVEAEFSRLPKRAEWTFYQPFRAKGWNNEGLIPWAGGYWGPTSRMYCDRVDFIFDQWHLTGFAPGMDVARDWMDQTKRENPEQFGRGPILSVKNRTRWTDNLLRQYLLAYEETFDPWFIMGAHAIAEMHLWMAEHDGWPGHPWQGGMTDYLQFTGDPGYKALYLRFAKQILEPSLIQKVWGDVAPLIPPGIEAWKLTGDDWFLRRALSYADALHTSIRTNEEPVEYRGWMATGGTNEAGLYYGWYLRWAPQVLAQLATVPQKPEPIPNGFFVSAARGKTDPLCIPEMLLKLPASTDFNPECGIVTFNLLGPSPDVTAARAKIVNLGTGKAEETALKGGITRITLPEARPETLYRVEIAQPEQRFELRFPIAPPGVKEVFKLTDQGALPPSSGYAEIWFAPASEVDSPREIRLTFTPNGKLPVRRASLWKRDGTLLSDTQLLNREINGKGVEKKLSWQPDSGSLLRLTLPGQAPRAYLPPLSVPWVSVSADKWFAPPPDR